MLSKLAALFLLVLILVIACTNRTPDKIAPIEEDEEEMMVEADSILSIQGIGKDRVISWLNYIHPSYSLALDSFKLSSVWIEDSLLPITYSNTKAFLDLYQPYLINSPDNNYSLDLDSYNIKLYKNKEQQLEAHSGEPDTQIFLLDNQQEKRFRLLFFGPGNHVDDAYWLDSETFILMGIFSDPEHETNKYYPSIYKINIKENLFEKYSYENTIAPDFVLDYTSRIRFKGITIK